MIKFKGGGIVSGVSRAMQVEGDNQLPDEVDVVVIGGGFIGCITALELAERGVSVVLCEKGVIAGEASGRAAGNIEYELLSPVKMELLARSMERWRALPARINADIGYQDTGLISLFNDEKHAEFSAAWLKDMQGQPGIDARMLTPDEIKDIDPNLGSGWHSALYQANGASIEPRLAAPAIAAAARSRGATLLQQCAVRAVERQAGKISSVLTEKGSIKTSNVVLAGGIWSSMIASHLGIDLPQLMIFAELASVEPVTNGPRIAGMTPAGYYRREPDGGYMLNKAAGRIPITPAILKNIRKLMSAPTDVDQEMFPVFNLRTFLWEFKAYRQRQGDEISMFEKYRIMQPEMNDEYCTASVAEMAKYMPAFSGCRIRERYTGSLMTTMDNLGVISSVQSTPGLYIGTGMLYGLSMGPAAGEALADMITGEKPKFDISPYRYERFTDGSKFEFHA
jgi:glycine/D-amino acid oxidase-like deaminating enzyme